MKQDVTDIGNGEPLFFNFAYEARRWWVVLETLFEPRIFRGFAEWMEMDGFITVHLNPCGVAE